MAQEILRLCPTCKGYGHIEVDTSEGRDRDSEIRKCYDCKGSGRLFDVIKTETKTTPFKYNYDKHRHELKRH